MHKTRIILGCDTTLTQSGNRSDEVPLLSVRLEEQEDGKIIKFFPSILAANSCSHMHVRKKTSEILVISNISSDGLQAYLSLWWFKDEWYFIQGIVMSMENGWLKQGSATSHGKVIWDSDKILNKILQNGD